METKTLHYYDTNALEFSESTKEVDLSWLQKHFASFFPNRGRILDFGCGSGRDTKAFLAMGFDVDAVDGSAELCKLASEYTGIQVKHMVFGELEENERYDGVWASASIMHLPYNELTDVFGRIAKALKHGGYLYTSFKYGEFEGERNQRYFTYLTEKRLEDILLGVSELAIQEIKKTDNVRKERGEEPWIDIILKKR